MASVKNSSRSKRKYGSQEARTAANRKARLARHENRILRFFDRTNSLIGQTVTAGKNKTGTVKEVLRKGDHGYPEDGSGPYLEIAVDHGLVLRRRKSCKKVKA